MAIQLLNNFQRKQKREYRYRLRYIEDKLIIKVRDNVEIPDELKTNSHIKIISESKILIDTVFANNEIAFNSSHFKNELYLCELTDSQNHRIVTGNILPDK